MEKYTPQLNEKKNEEEIKNNNPKINKASFIKTLGLVAAATLFTGGKAVAANIPDSNDKKIIRTEQVTSDNVDHITNNPNVINFFETSKSIDAVKYFENISDSISPESRKEITEKFVEEILKKINNDNFLEVMKLDWVIYAGDNGLTNMAPLHALAFKEILMKAKEDPKNFINSGFAPNRIKIIKNKEIIIETPDGGILPPTMFKKPNGDYYTIDEIDRMWKKHRDKLNELEKCAQVLKFGFYAPIGDEEVPEGKTRNDYRGWKLEFHKPCNCPDPAPTIFK